MRPEPHIRCSEYAIDEKRRGPKGQMELVWRAMWTVEIDFASGEEADAFVERVKREGLLPEFRHGPVTAASVITRRKAC